MPAAKIDGSAGLLKVCRGVELQYLISELTHLLVGEPEYIFCWVPVKVCVNNVQNCSRGSQSFLHFNALNSLGTPQRLKPNEILNMLPVYCFLDDPN